MQNIQKQSNRDNPGMIYQEGGNVVPTVKPISGWRYEWRCVNFSRFLYDRFEDLYIPEEVCKDLLRHI